MKTDITDEALRNAAMLMREAMLSSLDAETTVEHDFSTNFLESILSESKKCRDDVSSLKSLTHCCIVAMISIAIGVSLFFTINTAARAATVEWVKKVFNGQTIFSFSQGCAEVPLDFQLLWLPDGMVMVEEAQTEVSHLQLYQNEQCKEDGFVVQCGYMDMQSDLTLMLGDVNYDIRTTKVNGMPGELYISSDANISNALIWFDESNRIVFTIDSTLNADVILHIAENIKLVKTPK